MKYVFKTILATSVAILVFINYFHLIPYMLSSDGYTGLIASAFFFVLPFAVGTWVFTLFKDNKK